MRFGPENSSQLELKLTAQWYKEQVPQPSTDPPRDRTFSRATVNCTKNCPTCDQDLTIFFWTILSLWIHLFLSPSLPCFLFLSISPSIDRLCPLIPHLNQVPLKQHLPFPLTAFTSSPSHSWSCSYWYESLSVPLFNVSRRSSSSVIHPLELELWS